MINQDYYKVFASLEAQRDRISTYSFLPASEGELTYFPLRVKKPAAIQSNCEP